MAEKKSRKTQEEVAAAIVKAEAILKENPDISKITLAEKVGLSYPTLASRLGGGYNSEGSNLVKLAEKGIEIFKMIKKEAARDSKNQAKMKETFKAIKSLQKVL